MVNELAAQHNLSGQIVGDGAPLPYAEVILEDSLGNFLKGSLSDETGAFTFSVATGRYQLSANYLGFDRKQWPLTITTATDMGVLSLGTASTELETVTVTASKRLVEQQTDRLVFYVENSVAAIGGSGTDALQLTPGVRLQNGVLELIGQGTPGVLINDRLLRLEGEALTRFLANLNADDIERIEVISNPPARYAAAGQGGLINIVMKKGRGNAWKNNIALTHTQAFYGFTNLNNSFTLNQDKVSLVLGGSIQDGYQRQYEGVDATFDAANWRTEMYNKGDMQNASARLMLDYQFSERLGLGVQYLGSFGHPDFSGVATTFVSQNGNGIDSVLVNDQLATRKVNSHSFNAHGQWKLDTNGWNVRFDVDVFDYDNKLEQDVEILSYNPSGEQLGVNLAQHNQSDQLIDNMSARLDVDQPLKNIELSYGLSYTKTETFGDQLTFNTRSGTPIVDPGLSNTFIYKEAVSAAYLNANGKWSEQLDWQLGLRVENTETESYSVTLNQRTPNSYFRLFPTAYLSYRPSDQDQFIFSYGRRINRPGFRNLNPFRVYANSNTYSEGNPFLQPSFTDRFELVHVLKGNLRTRLFFNRTIDGHGTLFTGEAGEVQAVVRRNYFTDYFFGLAESYGFEWGKWSSQNQLYVYQGITEVPSVFGTSGLNGLQFSINSSNTFRVWKGGKLQLNAWYNAPHRSNVFRIASTWSVTLGWRQQIGPKLELAVVANDIFDRSSLRSLASEVNGMATVYAQNYAARNLRFSLSYRFGNDKINVRERRFGNEEVRGRSR